MGHPAYTELLRRLEDSVLTSLYYAALRPDSLPAHLQKPQLQLACEQLPLLTRHYRWYARRSIPIPATYTQCICGHTEDETWDHFKTCPLYRGLDTLTDWNPANTIAEHARWPTWSPTTQKLTTILRQAEVLEAVRKGLVPTAVYTCAPTRTTPRPRRHTCNGRPSPKRPRNSCTAPTCSYNTQPPYPRLCSILLASSSLT